MKFHFSSSRGETKNNFSPRISRDRDSCQGLPDGATCISSKFGHQMEPHALVANLATRGTTCISYKLDHQVESFASVAKLSTRWCYLYKLEIWPPYGDICFSYKIGHQMAPLALVANLATRWRHLH